MRQVRAAVALLGWLEGRNLTLGTCGQADLDQWLSCAAASHRNGAGHFVRWAARQQLASVSLPAVRWQGPVRVLPVVRRELAGVIGGER